MAFFLHCYSLSYKPTFRLSFFACLLPFFSLACYGSDSEGEQIPLIEKPGLRHRKPVVSPHDLKSNFTTNTKGQTSGTYHSLPSQKQGFLTHSIPDVLSSSWQSLPSWIESIRDSNSPSASINPAQNAAGNHEEDKSPIVSKKNLRKAYYAFLKERNITPKPQNDLEHIFNALFNNRQSNNFYSLSSMTLVINNQDKQALKDLFKRYAPPPLAGEEIQTLQKAIIQNKSLKSAARYFRYLHQRPPLFMQESELNEDNVAVSKEESQRQNQDLFYFIKPILNDQDTLSEEQALQYLKIYGYYYAHHPLPSEDKEFIKKIKTRIGEKGKRFMRKHPDLRCLQ